MTAQQWKPPGFMAKITGFVLSYAAWAKEGFPRRSPEWVVEIFETHCKPCQYYDPNGTTPFGSVGTCTRCGCHVSDDCEDMLNKIVLPTSSCPLDPPKWKASVECSDDDRPAWAKLKRKPKP